METYDNLAEQFETGSTKKSCEDAISTLSTSISKPSWMDEEGRPLVTKDERTGRYICPWGEVKNPSLRVVFSTLKDRMWKPSRRKPKSEEERKKYLPVVNELTPNIRAKWEDCDESVNVRWIGHATCLIRLSGGFTVLTDPVFSKVCAPIQVGFPRFTPPALQINELPQIDVILISHDHYDHLDIKSLSKIYNLGILSERGKFFVPLGTKTLLLKEISNLKPQRVVEMGWWESDILGNMDDTDMLNQAIHGESSKTRDIHLTITCLPAQHWCCRNPYDRNKRLWCSWAVQAQCSNSQEKEHLADTVASFYFAGDTGYNTTFNFHKMIGNKLGPFDFAAIPIGAYEPKKMMAPQHCSPEEAVEIHLDVRSRHTLAIHWGTWPLANEGE